MGPANPHCDVRQTPRQTDAETSADQKPHNRSHATALFAAGLGIAVVSSAIGGFAAVALHPHLPAFNTMATSAATSRPASLPTTIEQVAAKVVPSVVKLQTNVGNQAEQGSGIILSADGLIMTNDHVVSAAVDGDPGQGGGRTVVTFADGVTAPFTVVATDPTTDIAVVRAAGASGLTPITFGSSANLRVGQQVAAVGSPLGLGSTVTTGIVSALDRPVSAASDATTPGTVMDAIQTDAPINPGNSGGALVNTAGQLIGMNTANGTMDNSPGESGSIGIGFAIPVNEAKRVADELISTGSASHGSMGVQMADDVSASGARITEVASGGPAAKAGLPAGAVVTKVDNQLITNADALVAAVRSKAPGDAVTLNYLDPSGAASTAQVVLGSDRAEGQQ
jgi:putative serine protease PepD